MDRLLAIFQLQINSEGCFISNYLSFTLLSSAKISVQKASMTFYSALFADGSAAELDAWAIPGLWLCHWFMPCNYVMC